MKCLVHDYGCFPSFEGALVFTANVMLFPRLWCLVVK